MKNIIKLWSILVAVVAAVMAILPVTVAAANEDNADKTYSVANYSMYSITDNTGYYANSNQASRVDTFPSGQSRLGSLKIKGNLEKKSYNGYEAYAVLGGEVTFEYKQTVDSTTYGGQEWKLSQDSATEIAGQKVGTIGDGAILIMKSYNGVSWEKEASSVQINGDTVTFRPRGSDVQRGIYYKFISVAETYYTYASGRHKDWKVWPFKYNWVTDYSNYYVNLLQETVVFVASDSAQVGFYTKETDEYEINTEGIDDVNPETLEILHKGASLSDGSVSLSEIRLDKLGNSSYTVQYSYNDSELANAYDGEVFTAPGKYHFVITTLFGTVRRVTLYIVDPGEDLAYSQYFSTGVVSQEKRVFDKTSSVPVYLTNSKLSISPMKNLPPISGTVYRYSDAAAVENGQYNLVGSFDNITDSTSITLYDTGIYIADMYVGGLTASGEVIHYGFCFMVTDSDDYKPSVNLEMLKSPDRNVMLATSMYATNFPTAGGGSYVFLFPSTEEGYESALSFAEEIEYRFIEEYQDENGTYYYYKGHNTSHLKERFDSKVEMYAAIQKYAKENVNLIYSNSTEAYATMTLDEAISNIENTSIRHDIKVCVDAKTRDQLVSDDIIINGYKFYQAAVYESERVTAIAEDGKIYIIPYDTPVESVLPSTGRYLITETNHVGKTEYYVSYFAEGEVTGYIDYTFYWEYTEYEGRLDSACQYPVVANTLCFTIGQDNYDSQTIVTIVRTGERKSMLLSEIDGFTLSEPGTYTVTITNRCGFSISTTVIIEELPGTNLVFKGYEQFNREVRFGEALGELPTPELYGHNFISWMINGSLVSEDSRCVWADEVVLTPCFEAKHIEVILNYFNGYTRLTGEYGTTLRLEDAEDIEDLFVFAYWELDGEAVCSIDVTTLDTLILVAKYYRVDDRMNVDTTTSYNAHEVAPIIAEHKYHNHAGSNTQGDKDASDNSKLPATDEIRPEESEKATGTENQTASSENNRKPIFDYADRTPDNTEGQTEEIDIWTVLMIVCYVLAFCAIVVLIVFRVTKDR